MTQAVDTILLNGGAVARIVWSDHDETRPFHLRGNAVGADGSIHVDAEWHNSASDRDLDDARAAASGRAGRPEMTWCFVIENEPT